MLIARRTALLLVTLACAAQAPRSEPVAPAATAPDYDTLVKVAASYSASGRSRQAAQAAERAAGMRPERPEAYVVWGRSLAQENQLAQAAAKYEKARSLKSRDRALYAELASVYDVSKRYADAIAVYRDYLATHANDADMQEELGLTLLLVNRVDEAVAALRIAAQHSDGVQAAQDLALALLRHGEPREASEVLRRVLDREPSREARLLFAQAKASLGEAAEALATLNQLLAHDKNDTAALRMRAHVRLVTHDATGALADFDALQHGQTTDAAALLGAAGALIALGHLADAEARVQAAQKVAPEHPLLAFRAAQLALRRGDASALAPIISFARANPGHVEAWRELYAAAKKRRDKKLMAEARERLTALGDAP